MPPYILAVDLGGTQIRAALCDPSGQMLRRVARPTRAQEGRDVVLERIYRTIGEALEGTPLDQVIAIGIGAPGPLNPSTGIILRAPNLPGWQDTPLRSLVSQRFSLPTYLGNDANLAGLAEHKYGAARGIDDMIYLTISTGIGGGIITNGQMLLGARGLAAEPGHMIIDPAGPLCGCGGHGCLETLAAGPAITRDVVKRLQAGKKSKISKMVNGDLSKIDARIVDEAAQAGDRLAVAAFRRAGHALGIGIVNLLRLFNPRMIVLGGSVTKAGPLLFEPMNEVLRDPAFADYTEGLAIAQAALGDDVGLLGAVALVVTETQTQTR
ncbi:MAG TPA: ROK family protein [Anaerolineae bacterium]